MFQGITIALTEPEGLEEVTVQSYRVAQEGGLHLKHVEVPYYVCQGIGP